MREGDESRKCGIKRRGNLSMQNFVKRPEGKGSLDTSRSRWEIT
jgi:hypothetical protein